MRLLGRLIGITLFLFSLQHSTLGIAAKTASATRLPFLANNGQVSDPSVCFVARTFGGLVSVHQDGLLTYCLPRYEQPAANERGVARPSGTHILRERLLDMRASAPHGEEQRLATASFFVGSDPAAWRTGVMSYDAINMGEVYEGICLRLKAAANNVEKIFVVAPGAEPARIRVGLEGVDAMRVLEDGRLELDTPLGQITFSAPVAFQEQAGQQTPVAVAYKLIDGGYAFELGAYDRSMPLVIDPLLSSTFIGGTGDDVGMAVATDLEGNVYVAGYTASLDFPATEALGVEHAGKWDAFVSKLDMTLSNVVASAFLGGSEDDAVLAMVAANDRVIVAGFSESDNYPVTYNAYGKTHKGGKDAVISVLRPDLAELLFSTYLGGENDDVAHAVCVGYDTRIRVAGQTWSYHFPVTDNASQYYLNGPSDAFAASFDATLSYLYDASFLGGEADDAAYAMDLDLGSVVIAGQTWSEGFPVATNAFQLERKGESDAFVTIMPLDFSSVVNGTYLGGANNEGAFAVVLDKGLKDHSSTIVTSIFVAGYTDSEDFPISTAFSAQQPFSEQLSGEQDAFLVRMRHNCTNIVVSTYVGGSGIDVGRGLVLDPVSTTNSHVILVGTTDSDDFPATANSYCSKHNGMQDGFLIRFTQFLTNQPVGATYIGGLDDDCLNAVALFRNSLYVAGASASVDYPATDNGFEITHKGGNDVIVSRFGAMLSVGALRWRADLMLTGIPDIGKCYPPALDMHGNVYVIAASSGNDGYLFSFSPEGTTNWYFKIPNFAFGTVSDNKNIVNMSPAVDTNGNIYIGGGQSQKLLGYRPDGTPFLEYEFVPGAYIQSTPAISSEGHIILGNSSGGYLRALDSLSTPPGALVWKSEILKPIRSSAAIDSGGNVFIGSDEGVMAHNNTGGYTWVRSEDKNFGSSPALDGNGKLYIGGAGGYLYALDTDGHERWQFQTAGAGAAINGSPVLTTNGFIVAMSATNVFVLKDMEDDAVLVWSSMNMTNDPYMSPAIGSEGSIIVPTTNHVFSFTPTETGYATNWTFRAPFNGHLSSPVIAQDGTIYVGGISNVYAILGNEALANTPWPMAHHDAFHTGNQGFSSLPTTPLNVQASKGDPLDRIRITWDYAFGATRYQLYRATNDTLAAATNLLVTMRGNVFYDNSELVPGQRYYYRVIAQNQYGISEMSESDYGGIPPLPPAAVQASKGPPDDVDRIKVSWTQSDYATSYQVWRSTNSNPALATNLISVLAGLTIVDDDIALGGRYYYFIKSANDVGVSAFGAFDHGGTPPLASHPSVGKGVSLDGIPISWPFVEGAEAFEVWRSVYDIPVIATRIAVVTGTDFFDDDVVPNNVVPHQTYYYWLKVINEFGASAVSASDFGWRSLYEPMYFETSVGGVYSTKVHTAWIQPPYGLTYEIYRGPSTDFSQATYLNRVGGAAFDDTTIVRGNAYYYWIRAWNEYGASAWVGPGLGGTPCMAPPGLMATSGDYTDRIMVNWEPAHAATGYLLYRGTSIDSSFASRLLITQGLSFEDRAVIPGQRYYYWAQATNVFGASSLSASDSGYVSLSPPDGIIASDGTYTNCVKITWNETPGATTYEVYRNTSNNTGTATRLIYTAERFYDDLLAVPGTLYYYWVRARTASFSSGLSQPDTGYAASGLADLDVYDFVFLPSRMGLYASPDAVSFKIRNIGPQPLFGENTRIAMDFYASVNTVFGDADDVWFGRATQDIDLPVGSEQMVALSAAQRIRLEIPYLDAGSYYIFMIVRHSYPSSYLDPDMGNNTARRPHALAVQSFAPSVYAGVNDYNGDGRADLAAYDYNSGRWYIRTLDGTILAWAEAWGGQGMIPVLGDFDADRNSDLAVYDTNTGLWYVRRLDGTILAWAVPWGGPGYVPVWGDYNGDGKVDLAVYHPVTGSWFIRALDGDLLAWGVPWGGPGMTPVMGDYNGDGSQDLAVYHAGSWSWYIRTMSGSVLAFADPWGGTEGFIPVPGDYDGDGLSDQAVYHPATGYWFIKSADGDVIAWGDFWGGSGMNPVPGDYDGDGRSDLAVYNVASGEWYIRSLNGSILAWSVKWGGGSIRPVGMVE